MAFTDALSLDYTKNTSQLFSILEQTKVTIDAYGYDLQHLLQCLIAQVQMQLVID